MNDQQVQQRIKYLVEHGGIAEDPVDDLTVSVHWAHVWHAAIAALVVIDIAIGLAH